MKNFKCFLLTVWLMAGVSATARAQDAGAGAAVFKTQCSACHSVAAGRNMVGPSLFGAVDRPAGQVPGFDYSPANNGSGLTWDTVTLDRYLADPQAVVPKTMMPYAGLKNDAKRGNLIAYLATLH